MAAAGARSVRFPQFRPTVGELVGHVAERYGDRTLCVLGADRLTYRAAEERSALLARGLLAGGVGKGTRVGLLAPNGPQWIVAWLAAARIGALVVLLNTYHKPRELSWALRHADVQVLITADHHLGHDYLERLETIAPDLAGQRHEQISLAGHPYLRAVWVIGDAARRWCADLDELSALSDSVAHDVLTAAEAEVMPSDPAVIVYSSGSAAEPKGAVHSHGALIRHSYNLLQFRDFRPGDVLYTPMPLFWVGGLSFTLLCGIHDGVTIVFEERFEPGATLDLIERERVTHVVGWPHMSKALAEHPSFADRDLSSVRGGSVDAVLPADLRVGNPELRANSLGMTESLGPHSIEVIGSELPPDKAGSFGRSVPGVEHRIMDPATGEDLPTGQMGEIWIRGYSLMLGLHKVERADTFTPDGWYRTGDSGYLDADGHLYFTGRLGDQIKSAGMNITPREVELVFEEQPEVMHAFVMGVPHDRRGEDVAAAVVLRPGVDVDTDDLRARLAADLASYKVPRHVATFVDQQELPWLDTGKIDRRALTRLLAERFAP